MEEGFSAKPPRLASTVSIGPSPPNTAQQILSGLLGCSALCSARDGGSKTRAVAVSWRSSMAQLVCDPATMAASTDTGWFNGA